MLTATIRLPVDRTRDTKWYRTQLQANTNTMQSLADTMMANFTRNAKKSGGIRSEWQEAVERAMGAIDNKDWKSQKPWTYVRWCGYLKGIPAEKIHLMLSLALKSGKPGAHFNFLVKLYREEMKTVDNSH